MTRTATAVGLVVALAGLLVWQHSRARQIAACLETNGLWDGATSTCRPAPGSPIIQRDIRRS